MASERKIRLQTLFSLVGMGRNSMANITGGSFPTSDNLAKIADVLDCSIDYLIGRTDDPSFTPVKKEQPEILSASFSGGGFKPVVDQVEELSTLVQSDIKSKKPIP